MVVVVINVIHSYTLTKINGVSRIGQDILMYVHKLKNKQNKIKRIEDIWKKKKKGVETHDGGSMKLAPW